MDRRDFLKTCGLAGASVAAGGALSQLLSGKLFAAGAADGPLVIRLKGSPRDMGRQYADQAHDLILARLKILREKGAKVEKEVIEAARVTMTVMADSVVAEVVAMAERLGENVDDLLTLSAEPPGVGLRVGGCSSFALDKAQSKDGKVWMGQNVDDAAALARFGVVVIRHPLDGPPTIHWALAGGLGAIGMNRNGHAILMNYARTRTMRADSGLFPEFVAHAALRCKSFDEMMKRLTETSVMAPVIYLVVGADGMPVAVERVPLGFNAWSPPKGGPAGCTNHFITEVLRGEDASEKAFPDSKARLKRLGSLLSGQKDVDQPDYAKKILSDTEGKPNGICRQADPPTIASIILCPSDHKFFVTRGAPDREKYVELVLAERP